MAPMDAPEAYVVLRSLDGSEWSLSSVNALIECPPARWDNRERPQLLFDVFVAETAEWARARFEEVGQLLLRPQDLKDAVLRDLAEAQEEVSALRAEFPVGWEPGMMLPDGHEAEELRAGLEKLLEEEFEGTISAKAVQRLLDEVDARDSLHACTLLAILADIKKTFDSAIDDAVLAAKLDDAITKVARHVGGSGVAESSGADTSPWRAAHERTTHHRDEVLQSETCGCFHCLKVFPPSKIVRWIHDGATALCPRCGVDAVIGSASGYDLQGTFLRQMQHYWFVTSKDGESHMRPKPMSEARHRIPRVKLVVDGDKCLYEPRGLERQGPFDTRLAAANHAYSAHHCYLANPFAALISDDPDRAMGMFLGGQHPVGDMTFLAEVAGQIVHAHPERWDAVFAFEALCTLVDHPRPLMREGALLGLNHAAVLSASSTATYRELLARVAETDDLPALREIARELLDDVEPSS